MGKLIEGDWTQEGYNQEENEGKFKRWDSAFRNWLTADGSDGPDGQKGFKAEKDRYHLYVSLACPWAHRALIVRKLKGLEEFLPLSVTHWHMGENGWSFEEGQGVVPDPEGADYLHQVYTRAEPKYSGRVTVPVLWDKKEGTIVNNESSEIIRMLNTAFDDLGAQDGHYYPEFLRDEIDQVNERVYNTLNNGVYKCGFSTRQDAYDQEIIPLFQTLEWLDAKLANTRYLVGNQLTEADIRLFTTLARFDLVYHGHFKCNQKRLVDYPALWAYTRDIYQTPGIAETCDFYHIPHHYYESHPEVNPTGIVPIGPDLRWEEPHQREALS